METQEATYYVKLKEEDCDPMGYITYVFECLDYTDLDKKYIMCVRFPNWNQSPINKEDIGYLSVRYVRAGIDKWYDGKDLIAYKYTNIIFLKFISEKEKISNDNIVVD